MKPKAGTRARAADILKQLLNDRGSLDELLGGQRSHADFALLQELCFGACRWYEQLSAISAELIDRPLKQRDSDIHCLIILGLYQLRELSIKPHAAINETVSACSDLHKPWARGLVNAVLRNYQRKQEELEQYLLQAPDSTRYAFPQWLQESISQQWPDHAEQIMTASNGRPPMTLRVNRARGTALQYKESLEDAGHSAKPGSLASTALYLDKPVSVSELPGFEEGMVSVQDEASQLAADLLQLAPGQRVLDACAAPGGKTCAILESEQSLTSHVALDAKSKRVVRIDENLQRLGLQAKVIVGNALDPQAWWDGEPFNRILLDAPCSATGVIRRHPDIKLLRKSGKIAELARLQSKMLRALWPSLAADGLLLYCTCSLLRDENERVVADFVESTDNAKHEALEADWGVECSFGRQLLPGLSTGTDGFYYALLRKC